MIQQVRWASRENWIHPQAGKLQAGARRRKKAGVGVGVPGVGAAFSLQPLCPLLSSHWKNLKNLLIWDWKNYLIANNILLSERRGLESLYYCSAAFIFCNIAIDPNEEHHRFQFLLRIIFEYRSKWKRKIARNFKLLVIKSFSRIVRSSFSKIPPSTIHHPHYLQKPHKLQ